MSTHTSIPALIEHTFRLAGQDGTPELIALSTRDGDPVVTAGGLAGWVRDVVRNEGGNSPWVAVYVCTADDDHPAGTPLILTDGDPIVCPRIGQTAHGVGLFVLSALDFDVLA